MPATRRCAEISDCTPPSPANHCSKPACDEAYYKKPISLRHPLIFYFGHTATFFINKFLLAGLIEQRIDPRLESMFAVGVDEMSWDDLDDARYDWPTVAEVAAYRNKVRAVVDRVIRDTPFTLPIGWKDPFWAVVMGIEHERIHLETSSVLIRQHALQYVKPHPAWPPCTEYGEPPANALVDIPAGVVQLGQASTTRSTAGTTNTARIAPRCRPSRRRVIW